MIKILNIVITVIMLYFTTPAYGANCITQYVYIDDVWKICIVCCDDYGNCTYLCQ